MRARSLLYLVAVIAVALTLLWSWRQATGVGVTSQAEAPSPIAAPALPRAPALERSAPRAGAEASRLPATADARDSSAALEESRPTLSGRVVDPALHPLEGARVTLLHCEADSHQDLDLTDDNDVTELGGATADARGEFAFEVDRGRIYRLRASLPGCAEQIASACSAGQRVEIVLAPAATVHGRVTRAGDGAPVGDVRVRVFGGQRGLARDARSDIAGYYVVRDVTSGRRFVEAVPPVGVACSGWQEVELAPGEDFELDLVLATGTTVRGRVIDARNGAPVADAEIGEGWTFHRTVRTDQDGRYEFVGLTDGYAELAARARGYGGASREFWGREHASELVVDFALSPARTALGRIVDQRGAPVENAYVAAAASVHEDDEQLTDWPSTRTDADGRFTITSLRRDLWHVLVARKAGHGALVYDFPANETELESIDLGTIVLPEPGAVRGRVLDESGRGYDGLEVSLAGTNTDRARFEPPPGREAWSIDSYVAERETRSDSRGRFYFTDVAPGAYELRARRPSSHESVTSPISVSAGPAGDEVVMTIPRGASISGRIVARDGGSLPGVYVSVDPEQGGSSGDVQAALDGTFRAEGLTGASYRLSAYPYPTDEQERQGRSFYRAELEGVQAGRDDVVLELRVAREISGRVLDLDGEPVDRASVSILDARGELVHISIADEQGSFGARVPVDEPWELSARPPAPQGVDDSGWDARPFEVRVPGSSGDARYELHLDWRP